MKNILIIGAGRSANTLIDYLLKESSINNWLITIADFNAELAVNASSGHKNSRPIFFDINSTIQRETEIRKSDIVVSMLPSNMHHIVAKDCLKFQKDLVTASYVSEEINNYHDLAKKNNIIFLNEIGLDPGIDHMSAMKVIDELKSKRAKIISFKSFCGGLVHPQSDNNPWNYKFTWNPRNVILAGQGISKFLESKKIKKINYESLFKNIEKINVLDQGEFEAYANRDSLSYISSYGLENISTMFRGTLRKVGFCASWNIFVKLGLTRDDYIIENSKDLSVREYLSRFLPNNENLSIEERFCKFSSIKITSKEFEKFKWLGLFCNKRFNLEKATPAQILQKITEEKLSLEKNDRDMVVMQHQFEYILDDTTQKLNSSLVVFGDDQRNTAMAKTVGLPVAIAVKLILNKKIDLKGVQIPTQKEIYDPVLQELANNGISFIDELI